MKPQIKQLADAQPRDTELGRALSGLPGPELPQDFEDRLRVAVEKERRRGRRRPGWLEYLVLVLAVAAVGGAFAWRMVPPRASTIRQVTAVLETRRENAVPTPPRAAIARGRLTRDERDRLERQVTKSIEATCTARLALLEIVDEHLPRHAVQASAARLAAGRPWPAPATVEMPAGDPAFVSRNWDGTIVFRLGAPSESGDYFVFRHVEGRWLLDEIIHRGV